jgi:hypothetical protein
MQQLAAVASQAPHAWEPEQAHEEATEGAELPVAHAVLESTGDAASHPTGLELGATVFVMRRASTGANASYLAQGIVTANNVGITEGPVSRVGKIGVKFLSPDDDSIMDPEHMYLPKNVIHGECTPYTAGARVQVKYSIMRGDRVTAQTWLPGTVREVMPNPITAWCTLYRIRFDSDGREEVKGHLQVEAYVDPPQAGPAQTMQTKSRSGKRPAAWPVAPPTKAIKAATPRAATPKAATPKQSKDKSGLTSLLKSLGLDQYSKGLADLGYDEVDVLERMSVPQITNMARSVNMKPGHLDKLRVNLRK